MHERQQARWQAVRNYTLVQRTAGNRMSQVPLYHERMEVDGEMAFRLVPEAEWSRTTTGLTRDQTLAIAEHMATGLESIGDVHMKEVGGPFGVHIKGMTNDMAFFLREVKKFDEDETRADAATGARMAAEFRRRARVQGRATVGERDAHVIRAEGLEAVSVVPQSDGPRFTVRTVTMLVDAEHYVPTQAGFSVPADTYTGTGNLAHAGKSSILIIFDACTLVLPPAAPPPGPPWAARP